MKNALATKTDKRCHYCGRERLEPDIIFVNYVIKSNKTQSFIGPAY